MTTSLTNIDRVVTLRSQALLIETPNSGSVLTITADSGPGGADGTRVEGTSGGVQILHTVFSGVPSVTVSTERLAETSAAAADTMTLAAAALQAAGLKNLYLRTGRGNDNLIVNGPDIGLPASGGAFWYLGGSGVDRLTAVGDTNFDLNDSRLVSGGGGRIQIDDIEKASLTGGASNNHLNAALFTGDVILDGAAGADLLRGGSGNDTVFGGTGNDRIYGNEGDDVLNGQDNNDQLFGGNGSDTLNGLSGNDRLYGEEDDDFLNGGANNDVLLGGNGNDTLFGGTEDDLLFGEAGDDILNGDAGNDQLDFGSGNDTGNGGAGNDLYLLYGTQNAEDLQLARNSATSATFRRKPRGLTSSLESKGITMDATDEFFIQALDGDDLIAIDAGFTQLGSVDGGNGSDTCTAPGAWTKVSC
jgi:Ca2+-binding RTX toxin-like protein